MYRIDNATAVPARPAPAAAGVAGYFTKGNPAGAVPATIVDDDWLNSVQEELMAILTAAGIASDKTAVDQVASAIQALAKRRSTRIVTVAGNVDVATTDGRVGINKAIPEATQVNLPAGAVAGDEYIVADLARNASQYNITVVPAVGTIAGQANYPIAQDGAVVKFVYWGANVWSFE